MDLEKMNVPHRSIGESMLLEVGGRRVSMQIVSALRNSTAEREPNDDDKTPTIELPAAFVRAWGWKFAEFLSIVTNMRAGEPLTIALAPETES